MYWYGKPCRRPPGHAPGVLLHLRRVWARVYRLRRASAVLFQSLPPGREVRAAKGGERRRKMTILRSVVLRSAADAAAAGLSWRFVQDGEGYGIFGEDGNVLTVHYDDDGEPDGWEWDA